MLNQKKREQWQRVTRESRCPICEKPDWCCVTGDGGAACCMRVKSTKPLKNGGWLHLLGPQVKRPLFRPPHTSLVVLPDLAEVASRHFLHQGADSFRRGIANQLGTSVAAMTRLRVGYGHDGAGDFATFPMRRDGKITGILRRYTDGRKKTMYGGKCGLFVPADWDDVFSPICLPEGPSDTAALLGAGFATIGRYSCRGQAKQITEMLRGQPLSRKIIVFGERDRDISRRGQVSACPPTCPGCPYCWPGWQGARDLAKALARLLKRPICCKLPPEGIKDARAWVNSGREIKIT